MSAPVRYPDTLLLLFAREPVPGRVKTRLQTVLGRDATLRLYEELVRHMARTAAGSGLCPWRFCVDGDPAHPLFTSLTRAGNGMEPLRQTDGDLGERMLHATRDALSVHDHVLLVGVDCASVDGAYLGEAMAQLHAGRDVVVGPAEDGGYVLLGLSGTDWPLFADMPWGSDSVMPQTRQRLRGSGANWMELPQRWDVDWPVDLARLSVLPQWLGDEVPPAVAPDG